MPRFNEFCAIFSLFIAHAHVCHCNQYTFRSKDVELECFDLACQVYLLSFLAHAYFLSLSELLRATTTRREKQFAREDVGMAGPKSI